MTEFRFSIWWHFTLAAARYCGEQTLNPLESAIRRRFVRRLFRILNQALSQKVRSGRLQPGKKHAARQSRLAIAHRKRHLWGKPSRLAVMRERVFGRRNALGAMNLTLCSP
jgi:hypothetical protein